MDASNVSNFLFLSQPIWHHSKSAAERQHIREIRLQLFERSGGNCELRVSPWCWDWISWDTMHACHIVSQARGGEWELNNLKAGCPECHIGREHNGALKNRLRGF